VIYKIRNKKTNKFSSGGVYPVYSNQGKIYTRLQDVKSHLRLLQQTNTFQVSNLCLEIVIFEVKEVGIIPANDINEKFLSDNDFIIKDIIT